MNGKTEARHRAITLDSFLHIRQSVTVEDPFFFFCHLKVCVMSVIFDIYVYAGVMLFISFVDIVGLS